MTSRKLKLGVGIATTGRREVLAKTVHLLTLQTVLPDRLVISPATSEDVDVASLGQFPAPCLLVNAARGSSAQRNQILSAVADLDVIVFFDDDFLPGNDYLENLAGIFTAQTDVVAVTGSLLADGATGPGLNVEQGLAILRSAAASRLDHAQLVEHYGTYGCNMAFRLYPIRRNGILFDENLPLYGWQEDIDFASQMAPHGRTVKSNKLRGVHLGIKIGRTSGVRFGYSQIANPIYLTRKGTMSRSHARTLMWRNLGANLVRSIRPEPWVDRKGRLKGNVLALADMVIGRISPQRILQLD